MKLAGKALRHEGHVGAGVGACWAQAEGVVGAKGARGPAGPAEVDVGVVVEEVEGLADVGEAGRGGGTAAELGDEGLALVRLQEGDERLEARGDLVRGAGRVRAGAVRVEVVVHVEDEFARRAV